jgi:hypothetical protein
MTRFSTENHTNYIKNVNRFRYFLIVSEWPVPGCRKVMSFTSHEAALEAERDFLSTHPGTESKLMIIHGEILSVGGHGSVMERSHT